MNALKEPQNFTFAYTEPGLTLNGKETPPYIHTGRNTNRLLLVPDEDISLTSVPTNVIERLNKMVDIIERKMMRNLEGNSVDEKLDSFYHILYEQRNETHLSISSKICDKQNISEVLDRRTVKIIEDESAKQKLCSGRRLTIKYGIDPTGSEIHLGHLVPILLLKDLQDLGHNIVILIGNFTATIGDPTGRTEERQELNFEQINKNLAGYSAQIGKILDLEKVKFVYNNDWYKKMTLQDFFNNLSPFTLNEFMNREYIKNRTEQNIGVSLKEFLYPVLQGYDSVVLKSDLAVSGSDQEFNELQGRSLQKIHGQNPQDLLTTELLPGLDGRKMSKTYKNCIFLTDSPVDIYGKVMSIKDELILVYFNLTTNVKQEKILEIKEALKKRVNPRDIKMKLAWRIVNQIYSANTANGSELDFKHKFQERTIPENIPIFYVKSGRYNIIDLLFMSELFASKGEARRAVKGGGIRINGQKTLESNQFLDITNEKLLLQFGKRKFIYIVSQTNI